MTRGLLSYGRGGNCPGGGGGYYLGNIVQGTIFREILSRGQLSEGGGGYCPRPMRFILVQTTTRGSQEPVIAHLDQICFQ